MAASEKQTSLREHSVFNQSETQTFRGKTNLWKRRRGHYAERFVLAFRFVLSLSPSAASPPSAAGHRSTLVL
ncbi:hypothetical protein CEXT_732521 [Caerostris extrusa]|uniref:Uncharacterized protein n=1 Tax=Caerostris extrusa TaxID=172846 RepID=A0AAV4R1J6_CAEEX|nr:hypothetical protein CEXT_732521 [Caerostris extrusa]